MKRLWGKVVRHRAALIGKAMKEYLEVSKPKRKLERLLQIRNALVLHAVQVKRSRVDKRVTLRVTKTLRGMLRPQKLLMDMQFFSIMIMKVKLRLKRHFYVQALMTDRLQFMWRTQLERVSSSEYRKQFGLSKQIDPSELGKQFEEDALTFLSYMLNLALTRFVD